MPGIDVIELEGYVPYADAYARQLERRAAVERGEAGAALFVLEHAPVLTLGRNTRREHLLCPAEQLEGLGIGLHEADRGGDVTYHGPGQLTAYPILNLSEWRLSIRWYLRTLEQVIIDTLAAYGLEGERLEGFTGVWVGGAKVAQVGVGVHNWVTFHGVAINADPDMAHFATIVPCGIADKPVASMAQLLGEAPDMGVFRKAFVEHFLRVFSERPGSDS